mgnify:CR=1 FL=1
MRYTGSSILDLFLQRIVYILGYRTLQGSLKAMGLVGLGKALDIVTHIDAAGGFLARTVRASMSPVGQSHDTEQLLLRLQLLAATHMRMGIFFTFIP